MKPLETKSLVLLHHHLKALRLPTIGAEAEKVAGGRVAVRVFALFVIDEGKIVLCDELTRLEQGAAEDRDLASRL